MRLGSSFSSTINYMTLDKSISLSPGFSVNKIRILLILTTCLKKKSWWKHKLTQWQTGNMTWEKLGFFLINKTVCNFIKGGSNYVSMVLVLPWPLLSGDVWHLQAAGYDQWAQSLYYQPNSELFHRPFLSVALSLSELLSE